jgi:hypothetical protein
MNRDPGRPGPDRRPVIHTEGWARHDVLLNRQVVISTGCLPISVENGPVKRTEIIRALIDRLEESSVDLTSIEKEGDSAGCFAKTRRALPPQLSPE